MAEYAENKEHDPPIPDAVLLARLRKFTQVDIDESTLHEPSAYVLAAVDARNTIQEILERSRLLQEGRGQKREEA